MLEQIAEEGRLDTMAAVERMDGFPKVLDVTDEGPWVCKFSSVLQEALASAPPAALDRWAAEWITAEEMQGVTLQVATDLLKNLSRLARDATSSGQRLYLWMSL